jgi:hypothetical protein
MAALALIRIGQGGARHMNGGDHLTRLRSPRGRQDLYMSEKTGGRTYRRTIAHNTVSSAFGASDQHSGGKDL